MKNKSNRTIVPLSKKGLAALLGFTISALPLSNAYAVTPPTTQNSNIIVSDDFAWAKSFMTESGSTISIDFSEHFPRLDATTLALTSASSQQGILTSAVSGKSVILTIAGYGTANIEVSATDQTGIQVVETFQVTIDKMGDIDGDGVVTSSDALFVSKVVKGLITVSPEEKKKYDINKDGSVTNADVTALMTLIANQKNGSSAPPVSENNYIVTIRNVNDAPVGLPKHFAVNEDEELNPTASLAADGMDIENSALSVSSVSQPAHGTLTLKADGKITYLPERNFNGTDSFTYKLTDGTKESAPITGTIEVVPVNDNPVANGQTLAATEDTPLNGILTGEDIDSTSLTYQLVTNGTKGTVVITNPATGAFTYMPNINANGTDSFTFKISDGIGESTTATVTLVIAAVNDSPSAFADQFTTKEDEPLTVSSSLGVLSNDTDVDGDSLAAILVSGPAHGSLTLITDGSFQYKPDDNFNGTDQFTYKVFDGTSDSNVVTVTLNVTPVNDVPWAQGATIQAQEDTSLNGILTGGDIDSTSLIYQLVTNGTKGTAVITNPATGAFTYIPNSDANGTDSFTFKISDGIGESTTATVTIKIAAVNDIPSAVAEEYTTNEDETLTVSSSLGVLSNDTDVDGDSLTAILVSGPAHGSFTLNTDGSFQYKPDDDFNGTDQFTYKVFDGTSDSNVVTVTLNVTPVNDVPWAQGATIQATEDTPLNGILTGGDIDSTSLTYQIVTNGTKGTAVITNPATGAFTYTPNSNANGTDSFTFKISDGISESTTATVTIKIAAVNDIPNAVGDEYTTNEDETLTVSSSLGVLSNDTDVDGDSLTAILVSGPSHGSFTLNTDGSFRYRPDDNFNGTDQFTYKANDGSSDSNVVTVTLNITSVNDLPWAQGGTIQVIEDKPLSGLLTGGDIDSPSLTYKIVTNGTKGTAVITNPATGAFTYTPKSNANGTDSFTFKISDGLGESTTATVTVVIAAVNDIPSPVADQYTTNEDETLTVSRSLGVLSNDTDVEGDSLTAILVSGPSHGSLILNSDGSFQYKPDDNFNGTDQFTYKASDGTSDSNAVTVTLNVTPVNDLPWAQGGTIQVTEDTPLSGMLTGGDIDSPSLTYQLVTNGTKGTAVLTNPATGAFTYTPNSNANGTDSFTFKISDGIGESATVVVNVLIDAVNDAPTVATAIANQSLITGTGATKLDLTNVFADEDGDVLTYSAVSSNASVASVSISGEELTLTPLATGTATITITANDGNGGTKTSTFIVKVTNPNSAPVVATQISDFSISAGAADRTIDLTGTFTDADHDVLTYSATSSDPSIATTVVSGNSLSVTPLSAGTATITVTAADGNGGTVSTSFTVTVEAAKNVTLTADLFDRNQLTEANLKAATIVLTLDGDSFKDTATEADFKLNNAPVGLTLGPALIIGNEAYLILDYDGPDFDSDISNFSIIALGSATESGNSIQSSNLTIKAVQEPNGPVFFSEYLQSDNGRVAIEIYNKGISPESGYTLDVYQYNSVKNKISSYSIPFSGPVQPGMTYHIINSTFYDFFDIMNTWYYNEEAMLTGDNLVNTAFILKKNGVVVDAIGDPNSSSAILSKNGTMVRKQNFAGGMPTYQEYQWSLYPNGTLQYFGRHTP